MLRNDVLNGIMKFGVFIVMSSVIMLNVIVLSVTMLNVPLLSAAMPNVIMMNVEASCYKGLWYMFMN